MSEHVDVDGLVREDVDVEIIDEMRNGGTGT